MQSEMERFKLSYKLEVSNEARVPLLPCDGALPSCCLLTCGLEAGQPAGVLHTPFYSSMLQCSDLAGVSLPRAHRCRERARLLSVMRGHVNIEQPFTLENQIYYKYKIPN